MHRQTVQIISHHRFHRCQYSLEPGIWFNIWSGEKVMSNSQPVLSFCCLQLTGFFECHLPSVSALWFPLGNKSYIYASVYGWWAESFLCGVGVLFCCARPDGLALTSDTIWEQKHVTMSDMQQKCEAPYFWRLDGRFNKALTKNFCMLTRELRFRIQKWPVWAK